MNFGGRVATGRRVSVKHKDHRFTTCNQEISELALALNS